jgi:2,3,4,5-tetrahydropyridine-2-carboxylate N-succinyltransferase
MEILKKWIEDAWENRAMLQDEKVKEFIYSVIELLDQGRIRVAEKNKW